MDLTDGVACTLTQADLNSQRERWLALYRSAGLGRTETGDGFRLRFRDRAVVAEELRALAAAENNCCGWASWTVEREDNALVLIARSTGTGITTLHAMLPAFAQTTATGS